MSNEARPKRERRARVKVCSLWIFPFKDKDQVEHKGLSGSIGNNTQFTILPNLWKKNERQPTHFLYLDEMQTVKEEKTDDPLDQDGGGCNG